MIRKGSENRIEKIDNTNIEGNLHQGDIIEIAENKIYNVYGPHFKKEEDHRWLLFSIGVILVILYSWYYKWLTLGLIIATIAILPFVIISKYHDVYKNHFKIYRYYGILVLTLVMFFLYVGQQKYHSYFMSLVALRNEETNVFLNSIQSVIYVVLNINNYSPGFVIVVIQAGIYAMALLFFYNFVGLILFSFSATVTATKEKYIIIWNWVYKLTYRFHLKYKRYGLKGQISFSLITLVCLILLILYGHLLELKV